MPFQSKLVMEDNTGAEGPRFALAQPLIYVHGTETITVPVGFSTDLASIPRPLWIAFPPVGEYDPAAVVHDFLYQHPSGHDRGEVDAIFRDACAECGVGRLTRYTLYAAVRAGGWKPWNHYRGTEVR